MTAVPVEQRVGPLVIIALQFVEDTAAVAAAALLPIGDQASPLSLWEAPCDGQVVAMLIDSEASADVDLFVQVETVKIAASAVVLVGLTTYKWFNDGDVPFVKGNSLAVESDAVGTAKELHVTLLIELDLRTRQ